jgi:2-dehydropantoate 2-reductase
MRFAMFGIGGVGGFFGGLLAKAGYDVTFVARGQTLAALQQTGLRVESTLGNFSLPQVQVTGNPAEVHGIDVIFVTVKAWQVPEAAQQIRPMVEPETMVVPLQNGVDAFDQLAEVLGAKHVLGGLCHVIAFVSGPGSVKHLGLHPAITIGEWDNTKSTRVAKLAEDLVQAGFKARVPDNIQVALWEKLLFLATLGAVGSVARCPAGVMRSVPETKSLMQRAMREIAQLARAYDIPLPENAVEKSWKMIENIPGESTNSLQRDIMSGRPSELSALSGAIVRLAQAKGVSCPVHEFVYSALLPGEMRARGQISSSQWPA